MRIGLFRRGNFYLCVGLIKVNRNATKSGSVWQHKQFPSVKIFSFILSLYGFNFGTLTDEMT